MSIASIKESLQNYIKDNWTDTPFKFDGVDLTFNGPITDKYIKTNYVPEPNSILMGRVNSYGIFQVYCYHKVKIQAELIADDTVSFLSEKTLDNQVYVHYGSAVQTEQIENFWCVLVHFSVDRR